MKMNTPIRAYNGYDLKKASDEATIPAEDYGPSMTVQSQAEDADLNVLMKRYGVTGKMPENVRLPSYGDYTQIGDYRSAWEAVHNAEIAFMEIPADVRAKFDNDPQKFLEFTAQESNRPEMLKLGLLKEQPKIEPPKVEGSPAPPPPSTPSR